MPEKRMPPVSIRDLAREAGVSNAAASYALRNKGRLSQETRARVLRVARQMGYVPDPRMASLMTQVQEAKSKEVLPLAWITGHRQEQAWEKYKFLSPYLEGATERARQAGYRIEIITDHEGATPMRQISRVLYHRGIKGVIITHQCRRHLRLKWEAHAAVALEGRLVAPRLNQVMMHQFHNLLLALKMTRRFGYTRIGVCLADEVDRSSLHAVKAAILLFQSGLPRTQQLPPLFFSRNLKDPVIRQEPEVVRQVLPWVRKHRPDVIVCLHNGMEKWLTDAGWRVPQDIGVVHLATDDDVRDWAGIYSRRREIGAAAVDQVTSLIQQQKFGLPAVPLNIEIRGIWQNGRTLLTPKR